MKTKSFLFFFSISVFFFVSCDEKGNDELETFFYIEPGFDTNTVISKLNIIEKKSGFHIKPETENNKLKEALDTFVLIYNFSGRDCQRWLNFEIYEEAKKDNPHIEDYDFRGGIEFNLDKHGYYIEAFDEEIKLPDRIAVNGNKIVFIGREYKDKGLPKDGLFTVPNPPKGKVIKYYDYEITKPYNIWGPHLLKEINKETGDSIFEPTILIVK